MRVGINGSDKLVTCDLGAIAADIAQSETDGFTSYWLAQTTLLDAISALAIASAGTSTITLGTAVMPTWTQHPQAMAASALTAQAATGGRFVLGIGLSHQPAVEGHLHMTWEKPVRHMLDYLDVLQPLLAEGKVDHSGDVWSYTGATARPTDSPPRVMLAALGEQMLKIAGRRADGTILWCVGPNTIERQIAPIINCDGNGQGCIECSRTSRTTKPDSSSVSRATASSTVSPGSTKPASAEYIPFGNMRWRARRHFSPKVGSMIATGSTRGKCSALHAGQTRFQPASATSVRAPQLAQKPCRACHSNRDFAQP